VKRSGSDLLMFVACFFIVWTIWVIVAWKMELVPEPVRPWFRTAIWTLAAALWVRWQKPRTPFSWLGLKPINATIAIVAAAAFFGILAWNVVRVVATGSSLGQINQIGGLALISGLVGVFVEELLFRGAMQTSLSEIARPWFAILIAAVLFLLIHVPGWVLLKLPIDAQIVGSVFAIGVICGVLRHLTQSIWPPIAAHWANNLGALF